MNNGVHLHDSVALLEDASTTHYRTGKPLVLRHGQIGTVVMTYNGSSFEVEFTGGDGRAYAILSIGGDKLSVLRETSELAGSSV